MKPSMIVFNMKPVRVVRIEGELWFVASDVSKVLGYSDPMAAIRQHCKLRHPEKIHTDSGQKYMNSIPSSDVMRLVTKSRLEDAEVYRSWLLKRMEGLDPVDVGEEDEEEPALDVLLGLVKKMKERRGNLSPIQALLSSPGSYPWAYPPRHPAPPVFPKSDYSATL